MNDPDRIVERVTRLVAAAKSAMEEAELIVHNAESDGYDSEVVAAAWELLEKS